MLKSLSIKNYALISQLDIDFDKGLNILTGETGAGKSILLGAIGLVIGQRADTGVLRDKEEKCTVEAVFDIRNLSMEAFFEENDVDFEEITVLRREITPQGKSRAFINDTPVNAKVLLDLGLKLIDIHSQHQNLQLNEKKYQLNLVDVVAGNTPWLLQFGEAFRHFMETKSTLAETQKLAEQSKKDIDYYEFQFRQLADAQLAESEQEELEMLLEKLTHADEIKGVLGQLCRSISDEERSVVAVLKENLNSLSKLHSVFPEANDLHSRLESVYYELKDIASEAGVLEDKTENDPQRAEAVRQRLDLIYSLQKKHKVATVAELLAIQNTFESELLRVSTYDQEIERLEKELNQQHTKLSQMAGEISLRRHAVKKNMEQKVTEVLKAVGIPNAAFHIQFDQLAEFCVTGKDDVSFLFSANKSQELQEIGRIASGGEMSRLMLAIKTLITDSRSLPTIIFDEIDTGVSGEVAVKMGQILKQMAAGIQVINITHLPQIAAKGDHHYKVYKYDQDDRTFTSIKKLTAEERVEEIAQMLTGNVLSSTSLKAAKELLG